MEIHTMLNRQEIGELPYAFLYTTRDSSVWKSRKRKIWWNAKFTPAEQEKAETIFNLCRLWYTKGVPDKYEASPATLFLWRRLVDFCREI